MKVVSKSEQDRIWESLYSRIPFLIDTGKWSWQAIGALIGLGGGIGSFCAAVILQIASWLTNNNLSHIFKNLSFILCLIFFPLMMLGAHFLDLLEKKFFDI